MAAPYGSADDFSGGITSGNFGYNTGTRDIDMSAVLTEIGKKNSKIWGYLGEHDVDSVSPNFLRTTVPAIDETNAVTPGADYTFGDPIVDSRVQNVCRQYRTEAMVAKESLKDKQFQAIGNQKDHQSNLRMKQLARTRAWGLYNSRLVNSSESVARRHRGIRESLVRAGHFTAVGGALTDTLLKNTAAAGVWLDGNMPDLVITGNVQKSVIDGFAYGNTPWTPDIAKRRVSNVTQIETSFGTLEVASENPDFLAKSVDDTGLIATALPGGEVATYTGQSWILVLSTQGSDGQAPWSIGYFRRPWFTETAETGDRWGGLFQSQETLLDFDAQAGWALITLS